MTTIIAVLGLFPLALGIGEGPDLLRPLGIVVFAGLSLGTLFTLFLVPCFYVTLHDIFRWNPLGEKQRPKAQAPAEKSGAAAAG